MMEAGELRHEVLIEQPMSAPNEVGEPETTWQTFAAIWASVEPLSGREYWAAQQVNSEVTHRVRGYWLPGVGPTFRVNFVGRLFDIAAVRNIEERNVEMQLLCIERPG